MYVPVLLSAAIVEELKLISVCCRWRVDLFYFHVVATYNTFKSVTTLPR